MRTTYNLVYEALQPVYEWAKTVDFDKPGKNEYANGPFDRTINLRFDHWPVPAHESQEVAMAAFFSHLRDDMMDLVTNGDFDNPYDALLKSFNGEVKRGERLSLIHIPRATVYREYKPSLNTFEYTLYVVLYVEFGAGQDDGDEVD